MVDTSKKDDVFSIRQGQEGDGSDLLGKARVGTLTNERVKLSGHNRLLVLFTSVRYQICTWACSESAAHTDLSPW